MKIVAAYIRVSTDDQLEYSPDSQLKLISEYAKRNDMVLAEEYIFIDEGISGKTTKARPAFNRMIGTAKLKPKPFDSILLWKFSRFARNREDSIVFKSMLRKQFGIDVISISENTGDDKMSVLIEALIEAMDEYYSINLAEEVKRGMIEKASRGEPLTAPPFGYDMENSRYIINEEKAAIIRMIFEDYANGMGYRGICQKLNAMGLTTNTGSRWQSKAIIYILKNVTYIGKIRWSTNGKSQFKKRDLSDTITADGKHQPIVPLDLWEKVDTKLRSQETTHSHYQRSEPGNWMLSSIVHCSNCGSPLAKAERNGSQCIGYVHSRCSVSHHIRREKLNLAVIESLEDDMKTGNFKLNLNVRQEPTNDNALKLQIEKERTKLRRIKEAYENGIDTLEEYRQNKGKIQTAIDSLEKKNVPPPPKMTLEEFQKKHSRSVETLKDPAVTEESKNELIKSFVAKIIFTRATSSVQIFYHI